MGSMKIALGKFFLSFWKLGVWKLCLMQSSGVGSLTKRTERLTLRFFWYRSGA
ncbi:unnamed protein product [Prunus brigantina]